MVAIGFPNAVNPTCALNACLQQVAGLLDTNSYYEACTSAFGAPATSTFTVDSIVSTTTVPGGTRTDEFVVWTTITQTEIDSTTQWDTVSTTVTETSTAVVTETTTVLVPADGIQTLKARSTPHRRKKRACEPRTSTTPSTSTEATTASPNPIPTNCANLDEFSSACSCITAVSDVETVTVTVTEPTTTNVVTATGIVWTTSTATVTEMEIEWTTETQSSTTTLVDTTTALVTSTTTVTETVPVPTAGHWEVTPNLSGMKWLNCMIPGNQLTRLQQNPGNAIVIPLGGGQPYLRDYPAYKLIALFAGAPAYSISRIGFRDVMDGSSLPVICRASQGGAITCDFPTEEHDKFLVCGYDVWVARVGVAPSGCETVTSFKLFQQ
ncbi:hypothetical protein VTJ49DRAFT_2510 [Mycothermus thermophilus]|uniref:Uncharacterized protein n=1 Tax=Humicola insolens TaxID=85995 RepID=A0ABR3V9Q7_HUMIN